MICECYQCEYIASCNGKSSQMRRTRWWGSMHTISSYHGNRPTNKQTQPQTHSQDRLQYMDYNTYTAASAQCSKVVDSARGRCHMPTTNWRKETPDRLKHKTVQRQRVVLSVLTKVTKVINCMRAGFQSCYLKRGFFSRRITDSVGW